MKFGLVATLLVATFVASSSSAPDFTNIFERVVEIPAVQKVFTEGLVKILEKVDFNLDSGYETEGVLFPGIDDPLLVEDDSFIIPENPLYLIGNFTTCSSTKITGLTSFHNYTRLILLPTPIKVQAEIRANEFNIHGVHLVDFSVLDGDEVGFNFKSIGEFDIDLSRGFAGVELHINPFPLNLSAPINVTAFILKLGFESFSINAAQTRLDGTILADPVEVDYASVNRDIPLILQSELWANITIGIQTFVLESLITPALEDCTLGKFINGEYDCIKLPGTADDEQPLLETIFEKNEELDKVCLAGPDLPAEVTIPTTTEDPGTGPTEPGTGSTPDEGETTTEAEENLATDLKPALHSSIILVAMLLSRYFF